MISFSVSLLLRTPFLTFQSYPIDFSKKWFLHIPHQSRPHYCYSWNLHFHYVPGRSLHRQNSQKCRVKLAAAFFVVLLQNSAFWETGEVFFWKNFFEDYSAFERYEDRCHHCQSFAIQNLVKKQETFKEMIGWLVICCE